MKYIFTIFLFEFFRGVEIKAPPPVSTIQTPMAVSEIKDKEVKSSQDESKPIMADITTGEYIFLLYFKIYIF